MSARGSLPLPPEGKGLGRFASAAHGEWLKAESLRLAALFGIDHSDDSTAVMTPARDDLFPLDDDWRRV